MIVFFIISQLGIQIIIPNELGLLQPILITTLRRNDFPPARARVLRNPQKHGKILLWDWKFTFMMIIFEILESKNGPSQWLMRKISCQGILKFVPKAFVLQIKRELPVHLSMILIFIRKHFFRYIIQNAPFSICEIFCLGIVIIFFNIYS